MAMQQSGGHFVMYDQNVYKEAPIFNLAVVNAPWASSHHALVKEFVEAEAQGVTFFRDHPTTSYEDMGRLNNISAASAKAQSEGFSYETLSSQLTSQGLGWGAGVQSSLVTKSLSSAAAWLYKTGQISTKPSNMAQYVDPNFVHAVVETRKA